MENCKNTNPGIGAEEAQYKAPHLTDYGPVSELTEAISGDTGDDGGFPSYTASII